MSGLFRGEALDHSSRRLEGEVVLAAPLRQNTLAWLLVVAVVAMATFASTATFVRKERVSGWIAPDRGLVRLTARDGGIVEALFISEGEAVDAGQPIARMRLAAFSSEGDVNEAEVGGLVVQANATTDRAAARDQTLQAEEAELKARLGTFRRDLEEARTRHALQARQIELLEEDLVRAETIASRGYLPLRELDTRRAAVMQARQQLSSSRSASLAIEREIATTQGRLREIPLERISDQADARTSLTVLEHQRARAEVEGSYIVRASVAGRVGVLSVQQGQDVPAGAIIGKLIPEGAKLEAELYVPSRAAGFIKPGQNVRLMYDAFPYPKFGAARGVVSKVSTTVLGPTEIAAVESGIDEPVFRVRVALPSDSIMAYGQSTPLQPGMSLQASIILDRRSLFEWLLDPIYAASRAA